MTRFGIIGGGNAGSTIAAHLKLLGHDVALFDAFPSALMEIQNHGNTIDLEGNLPITGQAKIDLVSEDLEQVARFGQILICTTPAHVHRQVAEQIAPFLSAEHALVLYPGRTGGVLEFQKVLREHGGPKDCLILETQTIAYACRKTGAKVHVFGYKQSLSFSGLPEPRVAEFETQIRQIFPTWTRAESLWHTSLHNIGMLFHPTPTLLNLGRMESGQPFDYYIDGFTPSIAALVEQLDAERLDVALAMGIVLPSVLQWLEASYGCTGNNLYEALQNNQAYVGIKAPQLKKPEDKLHLRYITEDVPTGLVPVAALGARLQRPTPTINTMIDLANAFCRTDFRTSGRNLSQLGLAELTVDQICRADTGRDTVI
jgi:opine dehydrogenase